MAPRLLPALLAGVVLLMRLSYAQEASPLARSVSPGGQWEYRCVEYGDHDCLPEIVKAGTDQMVLNLDQELGVAGPESSQAEIVWAPDSKRFAFNYSPPHAPHTRYATVAFYQLRDDKWTESHSPLDETSERAQLVQLAKNESPRGARERRIWHSQPVDDILKVREWTDANTAILYAHAAWNQLKADFLFTVRFDSAGDAKIIKTHRMSEKELEAE